MFYSVTGLLGKMIRSTDLISDSSKRLQSLDKGKRPLFPSDTSASKLPRLLRYAGKTCVVYHSLEYSVYTCSVVLS